MIFDGRRASQITPDDIRRLEAESIQEDQFLEYKRDPHPSSPTGRVELAKDVSALANAGGGYLIIGIEEDREGRASAITGVTNASATRNSIRDCCLTRIEPRLTQLETACVEVDGHSVVVCYVPESDQKPHAVVPNRESHTFYQRYDDGVKVMTVTEIRHALQGDIVLREIAELRREITSVRRSKTIARELELDVDEPGLLELETQEAFAGHAEKLFRNRIGERPYFRLAATPSTLNSHSVREHHEALRQLLRNPPVYRVGGFDVAHDIATEIRQSAWGLEIPQYEYKHLRIFWNGHLEFWQEADGDWISWNEAPGLPVHERPFAPLSLIESTASFVRLATAVAHVGDFTGLIEFRLGLYNVRGRQILPGSPNTYEHCFADYMGEDYEYGVFRENSFIVGPVSESVETLPGTVAFRLISDAYYRLGYSRQQVPFFDENDRFIYDVEFGQRS